MAKLPESLLAALGKAMSGEMPLVSVGGKSAISGLFPSGKKGKPLADQAIELGYLTSMKKQIKVGRKNKTIEFGAITEKGYRAYIEHNSPKESLAALVTAVNHLSKPVDVPSPDDFAATIRSATDICVAAINAAFAELRNEVVQALKPHTKSPADPKVVLEAISQAIQKIEPPPPRPTPAEATAPSTSAPPPPSIDHQKAVENDIVAFVNAVSRDRSVGCDFNELFNHLRETHTDLSIGVFHDSLRRLHESNRVRLRDWPGSPENTPRPDLSLFLASTLMYYARPSH